MISGNNRMMKRPLNCGGLVLKAIREADRIILETPGISGTIAGGVTQLPLNLLTSSLQQSIP